MITVSEFERQRDEEIIADLERITGVVYSDEQRNILKHRGGMCILACAGAGKTSVLTHLIAKRIMSHEIENTETLLCTTYSKSGAVEMENRVSKLLSQLGIHKSITVKTMHALYLGVLKDFRYPSTVIEPKDRTRFLREACADVDVRLDEEDFQTLDSLISYQINNLLNDAGLVQSYAYTLDDVPLEKYSAIRQGYNMRKMKAKVVDFDDMQFYMYLFLYQQNRTDILDYCRSKWTDIYVDEAQDMSRIQYMILKKIITNPDKLVIIGDDDQCLVEGTKVVTLDGEKNIEDIVPGDKVLTVTDSSEIGYRAVDKVSCKNIDTDIVIVETKSGKAISGTKDHKIFAINHPFFDMLDFNSEDMKKKFTVLYNNCGNEMDITVFYSEHGKKHTLYAVDTVNEKTTYTVESDNLDELISKRELLKQKYGMMGIPVTTRTLWHILNHGPAYLEKKIGDIKVGDHIPVLDGDELRDDVVDSIEERHYTGKVYDLSIPEIRNFIANNIPVHNCIYQWRGADPSIILNVCAEYDITRFVLSTNYRCAGEIVKLAAVGITHNTRRSDKSMQPYNNGGEIKVCDCGSTNLYTMSKYAYRHIKSLIIDKKVRPDQIAVLSRNNAHLCILSNMLFKDGIHCEASAEMKLTKSSIYKDIKDIIELASNSYNANLTANTLNKVCVFLGKANAKRFSQLQSNLGAKLSDLLGYMATKFWRRKDIKWTGRTNVPALAELNLAQSLSYLNGEIVENLVLIYKLLIDEDQVKRVTGLLALYLTATEFRYKDKPDSKRTVEGLVDYISDLIRTMGVKDIKSYLKVSEQYEEGRMAVPGFKVCMSTMHGAKGREWDNVILFADDNVTFPSFGGIVSQMKSGVAMSDIYYGIDENRRLHYVAMTRARKQLTIFTDKKNTGVYLLESLGIFNYGAGNNAHIVSMASNGELYKDILSRIDCEIFDTSSRYYYTIDISDLCANIEIDYLYRGRESDVKTINLDDIQTASPEYLVD